MALSLDLESGRPPRVGRGLLERQLSRCSGRRYRVDETTSRERVLRGGSFNNDPRYLRSAARFRYGHDVRFYTNGFRVVREQ